MTNQTGSSFTDPGLAHHADAAALDFRTLKRGDNLNAVSFRCQYSHEMKPQNAGEGYLDGRVTLVVGDLTTQDVDAIVNAANSKLLGGGGVDGAIHRRGGPAILNACMQLRATQWPDGLPTGKVAITEGGMLPARFVIHTAGPIYGRHAGLEAKLLADCYRNALSLANSQSLASIAFPAISTGVYGYPQHEAARIVSRVLRDQIQQYPAIKQVRLVFFDAKQLEIFVANSSF